MTEFRTIKEVKTIENATSSEAKIELLNKVEVLDKSRDFLGEAKALGADSATEKAKLVLAAALHKCHSNHGNVICQEVYDACVKNSKTAELFGVWTIAKVYGSNSQIWFCSGGVFFVTDQETDADQYIAASFVEGPVPVGPQKVR